MKNKSLHSAIAYWFLAMALVLFISGCRTKKSTTDLKQTAIENVSVTDNSKINKKETVQENSQETKTEVVTDKSFFEAWMSFESDKITITDKDGKVTEITNPRINKKSSQTNDIIKTEQTDSEINKVAAKEENQQNDVKTDSSKETKTDLQKKDSSKGKEPVWLYVVGAIIVGGLAYVILKKFNLIK